MVTIENARYELNAKLKDITPNVYYQPGDGSMLKYPCIVYNRQNVNNIHANNNGLYTGSITYQVVYMSKNGENTIVNKMLRSFPTSTLTSFLTSEGVYHEYYQLYWRI